MMSSVRVEWLLGDNNVECQSVRYMYSTSPAPAMPHKTLKRIHHGVSAYAQPCQNAGRRRKLLGNDVRALNRPGPLKVEMNQTNRCSLRHSMQILPSLSAIRLQRHHRLVVVSATEICFFSILLIFSLMTASLQLRIFTSSQTCSFCKGRDRIRQHNLSLADELQYISICISLKC